MTRKERVIDALNHKQTDIVPYFVEFTQEEHNIIASHLNDKNFDDKWGLHLKYIQYWGWPTEISDKPEHFKDDFGVVWNRSSVDKDIGVVDEYVIKDIENYSYTFPVIDEKRLRKEYEDMIKAREDKFVMAGFGFSVFERAWSLVGMENVLMYMITSEAKLERFFEQICEYNIKLINIALEYDDIDGIYFGDDWGQQKGLIMGPKYWKKFVKPCIKKMYDTVISKGKYIVQHSCGDVQDVFPDLIELGLDCYQTFQPEIYDIQKIKKEYGADLSFWGGISTQQLLVDSDVGTIKSETKRIMEIMSKGGGYIAAPTHAVTHDILPENILAMMDVFRSQNAK